MNFNKGLSPIGIILVLLAGFTLLGCKEQQPQMQARTANVEVVTLTPESLVVTTELPGRVSAYRIAEIRPQVSGTILKREFVEGSNVDANQSLYLIDPATYEATYNSAKANLASAVALAKVNQLTVTRYKSLLGTSAISQQEYDKAVAAADQSNAAVQVAEATQETARINLAYTRVYSPISGLIGKSTVTEGALVTASQPMALATVQQLDPIYVDMTQSASEYLRFKQDLSRGVLKQQSEHIPVNLILEDGSTYNHQGRLEFSDISVDESTGAISIRAVFPNPDSMLLPGMFVRAVVTQGTRDNSILVPQRGLTRDNRGNAIVKLVTSDNKVKTQSVVAPLNVNNSWLVTDGLYSGDKVITSGLQKVRDGDTVNIVAPTMQAAQTGNQ